MKKWLFAVIGIVVVGTVGIGWWQRHPRPPRPLVLYGNVDDRQLNLAFLLSERIAEVGVEEGDRVKKGDRLASLETVRIANDLAASRAALDAARAEYEKLRNGSRREDIEIARSGVLAARANFKEAESDFKRQSRLHKTDAVSEQIAQKAEAKYYLYQAAVTASESNLAKCISGPRKEEIAAAAAKVSQMTAQVAIGEQKLRDAQLYSPCDGIVRNRLLEPGEMASPQSPALILAVISPKWVRTYLPESMLTKIKSGDAASVMLDSMPGEKWRGRVGFISPNAEFTPKNVETPELRTSLVYEVRVLVDDPENRLKLGAPATVSFP